MMPFIALLLPDQFRRILLHAATSHEAQPIKNLAMVSRVKGNVRIGVTNVAGGNKIRKRQTETPKEDRPIDSSVVVTTPANRRS